MAVCRRQPYLIVIDNLETVANMTAIAPFVAATGVVCDHRCETGATYELLLELSGLDTIAFDAAVKEVRGRNLLAFDRHYRIHRLTYTFLRVVIAGWWG